MKIFFPPDGSPGCRVVVGQGFIDGFNDDHPDSNLKELTGATFSFDGEFQLTNVQLRNADLKKLAGPYMGKLISIVRDWAQDQKPPKQSGFRQALKMPWVVEAVRPEAPKPAEAPPAPPESEQQLKAEAEPPREPATPWYENDPDYNYRFVPGKTHAVVIRRRKVG